MMRSGQGFALSDFDRLVRLVLRLTGLSVDVIIRGIDAQFCSQEVPLKYFVRSPVVFFEHCGRVEYCSTTILRFDW